MRKRSLLLAAFTAYALLTVAAPMVASAEQDDRGKRGGGLDVIGLTADDRLIEFESDKPGNADTIGTISGLVQDTRIVGIDYWPATGELIGLGDQGGVYALSDDNARGTLKSRLTETLSGGSFGVDFNPTVDRLRVISDNGQNLRVNVDTGATLVDGTLSSDPPAPAAGVTGAAYTNNDADPNTGTTLFDLDSMLDQTVIQSPANSGQLVPIGKHGVDTAPAVGFDIYSKVRNGTTKSVRAFASLTVDGRSRFYNVNLFEGRASQVGSFSRRNQVTGIAIELDR
jgi:Domain of unknown function (DUF4394)